MPRLFPTTRSLGAEGDAVADGEDKSEAMTSVGEIMAGAGAVCTCAFSATGLRALKGLMAAVFGKDFANSLAWGLILALLGCSMIFSN